MYMCTYTCTLGLLCVHWVPLRFLVRVSYLEIYLEKVRDLLHKDPNSNLKVRVRPDIGVYAKGLTSFVVKSTNEMTKLMNFGRKNRKYNTHFDMALQRPHCHTPSRCRGKDGHERAFVSFSYNLHCGSRTEQSGT